MLSIAVAFYLSSHITSYTETSWNVNDPYVFAGWQEEILQQKFMRRFKLNGRDLAIVEKNVLKAFAMFGGIGVLGHNSDSP